VETGLAQSKRQAREFLQNGSVSVNGRKAEVEDRLGPGDLLHGQIAALRRGKKSWHATRWV
jgi:tyrosyl-tRNA synthetase